MRKDMQQYIKKGSISRSDYQFLEELDPSKTKKYLPFIIKLYLADANLDLLRNRVTEYDTLLAHDQVDRKDINSFKTLWQLDEYVQAHNNTRSTSEQRRQTKKDAEVILDTADLFIVSPYSHAASCLYGAGTKWCVTAENSSHWERYFYEYLVTFYYVQVRSDRLKQNLKQDLWKIALAVYPKGKLIAYDAVDHRIGSNESIEKVGHLQHLFQTLCVDASMFIPRGIEKRLEDIWPYRMYDTELDLSGIGLTSIPDNLGKEMFQIESLILSENNIQILPECIGQLNNLKTLYLFHNQLTSLPQSLCNMKQLQWLGLSGNPLPAKIIRELKQQLPATRIYTSGKS